jgi:hypothetical protein
MLYELGQFVCFPSSDGIYLFINLIKSELVGNSILDIVTQKDRRTMKNVLPSSDGHCAKFDTLFKIRPCY